MNPVMNGALVTISQLGTNLGTLFTALLGIAAAFGIFFFVKRSLSLGNDYTNKNHFHDDEDTTTTNINRIKYSPKTFRLKTNQGRSQKRYRQNNKKRFQPHPGHYRPSRKPYTYYQRKPYRVGLSTQERYVWLKQQEYNRMVDEYYHNKRSQEP